MEALLARLRAAGAPATVSFTLTWRCPCRCAHCYEAPRGGPGEELDAESIDRVLGEAAQLGALFATFTGGEVLLRDDALAILGAARGRGFAVKLMTTGYGVDEALAQRLADLGALEVHLSLYSVRAGAHDAVTGVAGSGAQALLAARRLRERGVPVVLACPAMRPTWGELGGVARLAAELGATAVFDPFICVRDDGDRAPAELRLGDAELGELFASEELGVWAAVRALAGGERPGEQPACGAGLDTVAIDPRGVVTACAALLTPAGDVRQQSLVEIWRSSPALQRVRALRWSDLRPCASCGLAGVCRRCHANAVLEDGALRGPSREACRQARVIHDLLRARGLVAGPAVLPASGRTLGQEP